MDTRRPCPCCGHLVFDLTDGWPGSFDICPVCFWEDDRVQFRFPYLAGGANRVSLVEAQQNYRAHGRCELRTLPVREPQEGEERDPVWRPIDRERDLFEDWGGELRPGPVEPEALCWWLPAFWGRPEEVEVEVPASQTIDVGAVRSERELHALLKRELGFPDFYGMNWDALWDSITGLVEVPGELRFTHWAALPPEVAAGLRRVLVRYARHRPGFVARYEA
jgi:RNAse (barnase) inhibitor barstar